MIAKKIKEIGCPIFFSKEHCSYCYKYPGKLLIKFETIDKTEFHKIKGGFFEIIFTLPNSGNEINYICNEKQGNSFSGFPTPNSKVGLKFK